MRVASYFLRVENENYNYNCKSILAVASYYSWVMNYFLRVENKNYELRVMAFYKTLRTGMS